MSRELRSAGEPLLVVMALAALALATLAPVRATNFGGWDEWAILSLVSDGHLSMPFANRPLELLYDLPAAWLSPSSLRGWLVLHGSYLVLSGVLVWWLCRRLVPEAPRLALIAACVATCWAPRDALRLNAVETLAYSGVTFGALLAIALFVEGAQRDRASLVAAGAALALVSARAYESVLPLLALAPLLPILAGRTSRLARHALLWLAAVACGTTLVVLPLLAAGPGGSYQLGAMRLDLRPGPLVVRLLQQFGLHTADLWRVIPSGATALAAALVPAVALFVRERVGAADSCAPRRAVGIAATGALLAGAGYSMFVASAAITTANRTQFVSSPGIALLLGGALVGLAGLLPRRARLAGLAVTAAWLAAVGATRTAAMQAEWDRTSLWGVQRDSLAALLAAAPDVEPGTLLVALEPEPVAWPANFTFRHAVRFLYEGRALGLAPASNPYLYPARLDAQGWSYEPAEAIRAAWSAVASQHRHHECLVFVAGARPGELTLAREWPANLLGPLPPGGRYAPLSRIRAGPRSPRAAMLGER
jgi:hypothetical protein